MRFIVDEGVDAAIVTAIRSDGHDVRWMAEEMKGSTDDVVLRLERDRLERRIQRQELNRKVPPAVGRVACGDWKFAPVPGFRVFPYNGGGFGSLTQGMQRPWTRSTPSTSDGR